MINAYRAFIGGEYRGGAVAVQPAHCPRCGDADAWYGLGEAWFHDTAGINEAPAWTQALRAFKRALALDPNYALAYDHVHACSAMAAASSRLYALLPGGLLCGHPQLDRPGADGQRHLAAAVQRAQGEALAIGPRPGSSSQPTTLRAHGAMVDAYVAAGNYTGALAELDASAGHTGASRAPLRRGSDPFCLRRCRSRRGPAPHRARHGRAEGLPSPTDGTPTVVSDIAAAANVFAYQGDLTNAAKALDLADQVRREVMRRTRCDGASRGRPGAARAGRAIRRGRGPGFRSAADLAERRRGRAAWRRRTSGSTWSTPAPPPPSDSSPASRPTAPR